MTYKIEVKRSVQKALKKIPQEDRISIVRAVKKLSSDPRPPGCLKLSGSDYYRIRCGDYRIIYDIRENVLVIIILRVGHRKNVYKKNRVIAS